MVFVADDLGAWLTSLLADASRRRLTALALGSDQERALRRAATTAVWETAVETSPSDGERAGQLALVISEVFREPMPDTAPAGVTTLLGRLQAGITEQLGVLDDVGLTGTGQSSADVLGVPGAVLADRLTRGLVREIMLLGSRGGPLTPLADQLNHDITHLQSERAEGMLASLLEEVRNAVGGVGRNAAVAARDSGGAVEPFALKRGPSPIQNIPGSVRDHAGTVRSAYLEQVRQIAPVQLRDRDDELAELTAFCIEPGRGQYAWWRAAAWTGKSALMSWFVLHPPEGIQVACFFVTARYAGQNDRVAFTEIVLEQLCEILGQSMPTYLTAANREAHLLGMLVDATEACRRRNQQLVLVVDGLDEDRGVTIGPDAHSIAALLPTRPAVGLKIIVAGRPDPPIPADVPDNHPLRDPSIVRVLNTSPWAEVIKADMQRELKHLLHGTPVEQDLLGLVTAAGGGLSGFDLAALTGRSVYEVEESMRAVSGRTFASRAARWQPGTVHVLGHEELQAAAERSLGESGLARYRQRLHDWADIYRQEGWPAGTPEYLLRGYYRLLHSTADISRIIACAADQARHNRMLDVTGGDTAALTEVTDAQMAILGLTEPDLVGMARLAVRRTSIVERNANLPVNLPALWAQVGQPTRAEALARAITDPYRNVQAMTALTETVLKRGELARARVLVERTEVVILSITDLPRREDALAALVGVVGPAGDVEHAIRLARAITEPSRQDAAFLNLASALATAGHVERAMEVAFSLPHTYMEASPRGRALMAIAVALAADDIDRAEAFARKIDDSSQRQEALMAIVKTAALTVEGDVDRSEELARTIAEPRRRDEAFLAIVRAVVAAGEVDRAKAALRS